jgi:hypothetical protein
MRIEYSLEEPGIGDSDIKLRKGKNAGRPKAKA